jgi:ferrochelatase
MKKKGILLINTGSPSAPTTKEVRKYLSQFLMDPYMLDMPFWKRWLLVHGIILRTRPKHSARLYKEIWTPRGSPLIVISEEQRSSLSEQTGLPTALGFRYGTPTIKEGLDALLEQGCDTIIGFPLFPQYSLAATESVLVQLEADSRRASRPHKLEIIPPFWNHPAYLNAWMNRSKRISRRMPITCWSVFMVYRRRHIRKADPSGHTCLNSPDCCQNASGEVLERCYRAQTLRMTQSLIQALGLKEDQYTFVTNHVWEETPG